LRSLHFLASCRAGSAPHVPRSRWRSSQQGSIRPPVAATAAAPAALPGCRGPARALPRGRGGRAGRPRAPRRRRRPPHRRPPRWPYPPRHLLAILPTWAHIGRTSARAAEVPDTERAVSYRVPQRRRSWPFAGPACNAWGAAVRWAAPGRRPPALSSAAGGRQCKRPTPRMVTPRSRAPAPEAERRTWTGLRPVKKLLIVAPIQRYSSTVSLTAYREQPRPRLGPAALPA